MGLEKTFYQVSEDVGVVEVCVIVYSPSITCPVALSFDVILSTEDFTAGIVMKQQLSEIIISQSILFACLVWFVHMLMSYR